MTITVAKTIEEIITHLILDMEESSKIQQKLKRRQFQKRNNLSRNVITFQQPNSNHQNNESAEMRDTLVEVLNLDKSPNIEHRNCNSS